MMSVTTIYARGPVSLAEYEALPDDGNRYELIDGTVYVTPPPAMAHQRANTTLSALLDAAAPEEFVVVAGPGYHPAELTVFIPDLVVIHGWPQRDAKYTTEAALTVEIVSPSSRRYDRVTKLAAYERAGAGAYWIVDPLEPSLLVFERAGERLVERAHVRGDETFHATYPFEVDVVPAALVARLR